MFEAHLRINISFSWRYTWKGAEYLFQPYKAHILESYNYNCTESNCCFCSNGQFAIYNGYNDDNDDDDGDDDDDDIDDDDDDDDDNNNAIDSKSNNNKNNFIAGFQDTYTT